MGKGALEREEKARDNGVILEERGGGGGGMCVNEARDREADVIEDAYGRCVS